MNLNRFLLTSLSIFGLLFHGCSSDSEGLKHLANLAIDGGVTDIWGYVDSNGREYAVVGFGIFLSGDDPNSGFELVDVSDPTAPTSVSRVTSVPGFDVKVWQNYVYTVNGGGSGDGGIVDISNPAAPRVVGSFPSAHNIFIAANGFMYLETQFAPLRVYDLNPDPTRPALVWNGGNDGHDAAVIGDRWYDFGANGDTHIYDVSNPSRPQLLSTISAPFIAFHHSGWPTEDGKHLFICDELADLRGKPADFTVWDISDLANPAKVGEFADPAATVHNLIIVGDFAYTSYYTAGFRIFDVSNPAKPKMVEEFDTSTKEGTGFEGAFGVYPFAPSGTIYVSDIQSGLHLFSFKPGGLGGANPLAP